MNETVKTWIGFLLVGTVIALLVAPKAKTREVIGALGNFQTGALNALLGRGQPAGSR